MKTQNEIYELGKKQVDYDRQLAIVGKEKADNVLFFWMKGYEYAEQEKWISVEDPPEDGKRCLVIDPNQIAFCEIQIARYSKYSNNWFQGSDEIHPTYYQPLLKSPTK